MMMIMMMMMKLFSFSRQCNVVLREPGSYFTRCRVFLDAGAGAQVVQRCADQCWHRINRPQSVHGIGRSGPTRFVSAGRSPSLMHYTSKQ